MINGKKITINFKKIGLVILQIIGVFIACFIIIIATQYSNNGMIEWGWKTFFLPAILASVVLILNVLLKAMLTKTLADILKERIAIQELYKVKWKRADKIKPKNVLGIKRADEHYGYFDDIYFERKEDIEFKEALENSLKNLKNKDSQPNQRNILITGKPLAGKSRMIYQALQKKELNVEKKNIKVTIPSTKIDFSNINEESNIIPQNYRRKNLKIILINDIHTYVNEPGFYIFFNKFLERKDIAIIATSRTNIEKKELRSFIDITSNFKEIEIKNIESQDEKYQEFLLKYESFLVRKKGDGTIGSHFYHLEAMRKRYDEICADKNKCILTDFLEAVKYAYAFVLYIGNFGFPLFVLKRIYEEIIQKNKQDYNLNYITNQLMEYEFITKKASTSEVMVVEEIYITEIIKEELTTDKIILENYKKMIELFKKNKEEITKLGNILYKTSKTDKTKNYLVDEAINCFEFVLAIDSKSIQALNELGTILYEKNMDLNKAVIILSKIIEQQPKNSIAWHNLGLAYEKQGDLEQAIECYQKTIELDPKDVISCLCLGFAYEKQGDLEQAIECYQKVVKLDPKEALVWLGLGVAYEKQDNLEQALEYYQKAVEIDPEDAHAWGSLGLFYEKQGDLEQALECYQKEVELDPENAATWGSLGLAYEKQGYSGKALECQQKTEELNPEKAITWRGLGITYGKQKNHGKALECYQKAIELDPEDVATWRNLGVAYEKQKNHGKTLECYQKVVELDPEDAMAWLSLGVTYSKQENHEKALERYQKAIELDPENVIAWLGLGIAYGKQMDHRKALECYQKVVELDPENAATWRNLGVAYERQDNYEKALECYQKAIEIDPEDAVAWGNLGVAFGKQDNHEKAHECYQKLVEINPEDAKAWRSLGVAFGKQDNHEKALECFKRLVEIEPEDAIAWINLGIAYERQDNLKKAIECYQKALEINQEDTVAWNSVGIAYLKQNNLKKAFKCFQKAVELEPKNAGALYNIACLNALQNENVKAIKDLKKAIEFDEKYCEMAKEDSDFDNIKDTKEFKELVGE
ncbi:MAG: tetratricopeptide repeat protein [Candidatus Heimdallarchaeaceae archaeon]